MIHDKDGESQKCKYENVMEKVSSTNFWTTRIVHD